MGIRSVLVNTKSQLTQVVLGTRCYDPAVSRWAEVGAQLSGSFYSSLASTFVGRRQVRGRKKRRIIAIRDPKETRGGLQPRRWEGERTDGSGRVGRPSSLDCAHRFSAAQRDVGMQGGSQQGLGLSLAGAADWRTRNFNLCTFVAPTQLVVCGLCKGTQRWWMAMVREVWRVTEWRRRKRRGTGRATRLKGKAGQQRSRVTGAQQRSQSSTGKAPVARWRCAAQPGKFARYGDAAWSLHSQFTASRPPIPSPTSPGWAELRKGGRLPHTHTHTLTHSLTHSLTLPQKMLPSCTALLFHRFGRATSGRAAQQRSQARDRLSRFQFATQRIGSRSRPGCGLCI